MGSDWDEIKRLAADFQKAQLTSTLQKLSERNCIEIVTLLLEKQLLDVVFTNDGKEYITPDHLEREIQDELYANGGRANLVEVSKTLNVDLSRIVTLAEHIAAENPQIHLMLGQLIDEDYITHIAQEINEKLAQRGEISISDLTSQFDLPSDFLQHNVVEKHLGKIIKGRQDATNPRVFFTQAYIQRCKAKIRGALAAITKPTNVAVILQQISVQEKIFHSLLDEIAPAGQVTPSKQANAQYVPHIYAKTQADWVNAFYKQNSFLEYDAINKLGISDAKAYIRKQFHNEQFLFLKRVALGARLIELTVVAALNECNATKQYLDLSTILPSNLSEEDIEEAFEAITSQKQCNPSHFVFLDSIVFSQAYLTQLVQPCQEMAHAQAKAAIDAGVYQQYIVEKTLAQKGNTGTGSAHDADDDKLDKRDERRKKAASGKAGGGAQGRETKTKSTKKHQRGRVAHNHDSEDEEDIVQSNASSNRKSGKTLDLVKTADITNLIKGTLEEEGLEQLAKPIAALYLNQLNQTALAKAQELYEATPQTNRRQTHAAIQERVNTLLVDIRLYEKGLKLFPSDTQSQLVKYLLKSLGNDICNELTLYVAAECSLSVKSTNLNVDQRIKLVQECDVLYRNALLEQNKAINKSIDEFELATEAVLKTCSMIVKKVDKKKDRLLIVNHKEKLQQQLLECNEPALLLHLAALILFTTITGCILHASGKFVSAILQHIRSTLNEPQNALLLRYHDLVLQLLQQASPDSVESKSVNEQLHSLQTEVVDLAQNYSRASVSKAD
ncbi:LOW QUALITY PROTEIN: E3 UFM1-protein ligase 1 homolog [Drosophila sulfurigaster albostrigata]|uniref:LOW QUALITY PROTEIN: E3 UFM1-protein ligase 1 homolog n=1 Tax=Drosophila sulfurigaster albostrigata TaxID=89887 RepID=UPI002D219880|nr:LOW QUALITY PROTEIN: E3 UFM1-protein ligase 1 homolog [Drosophila sulfurigaster albostrigata]